MFIHQKYRISLLKLIIAFKHIRFKSACALKSKNNAKEVLSLRIHKLSENLGCTTFTARKIVSKNNQVLTLNSADFLRNTKFCSQHLKLSDIVEFPCILSMNTSLLQHRYLSLIELGCTNVTANHILRFPYLLKKSPKEIEDNNLQCNLNLQSQDCLKFLENSEYCNEKKSYLNDLYINGSSLWKIREAMNAEFLSAKLNISLSRAHQLFRRYPPLRLQSILNTSYILDILIEKFGFTTLKISQVPNLLSLHHENVKLFLKEVPDILGISTPCVINKLPLLLRRTVETVLEFEIILKNFNISKEQLINCPKVMILTPTTLQQRLEDLCNSKDFSILKSYKKFLWLVYYFKNTNRRLQILKELDIPTSISFFTVSQSNFKKYLYMRETRSRINDVCFYLAKVLKCEESDVEMKLREYPCFNFSSLQNCHQVVNFLFDSGVSKKQLYNGIGIIFYDVDIVKTYFDNLKNHPSVQPYSEWVNHYNFIQLLIYSIEVDTDFMGFRLCNAKVRIDDEPLIAANCSV